MANGRTGEIAARTARALFDLGPIGDLADGQLLERCATDRAEVAELAFAALVERHEAMVWGVCRGILRDRHDAEDALQATFVVLARRARSLWVRDSLGPWLHEVAARTALRHRAATRRRLDREARVAARLGREAPTTSTPPAIDDDLAAALHEELARLPAALRAPLVVCDLEGSTHAEAARVLGWPIGTLKSRQARGRRALRARLARRGFVSLGVGPLLDLGSFGAIAPSSTADLAARLTRVGFASLAASPAALHLARETLHAMLWIKLRPAALVLTLGLASAGAGGFVSSAQDPAPAAAPATAPPPAGPARRVADDTDARLRLRVQEIATRRARIAYEQARSKHELAELAVAEAEEVLFPQDLRSANGRITHAEAALALARSRADWSEKMGAKGYIPGNSVTIEKQSAARAEFDLAEARTDRDILTKYTQDKRIKELRSGMDQARKEMRAREAAWKREQGKEEALRPRVSVRFPAGTMEIPPGAFW